MKNNMCYKNSFTDDFIIEGKEAKFKYPLTNPPYGGDSNSKTGAQVKRDIIKKYIKSELKTLVNVETITKRKTQLKNIEQQEKLEKKEQDKLKVTLSACSSRIQRFAYNNKLDGNDKESCSLMLLMDIVEFGGTAIGVLKEGIFFDKKYKNLRKCLVENYNVREIISIENNAFENTTTKTSIVIFDNIEQKTTEIKFSDMQVIRVDENEFDEVNNELILVKTKDDIIDVIDVLIATATKDEILANSDCSLCGKDYDKMQIVAKEGYELFTLGSMFELTDKGKRLATFANKNGLYNYYTCSDKILKCDIPDIIDKMHIIIGHSGNGCLFIDKTFSSLLTNHLLTCDNELLMKFTYFMLKSIWAIFYKKIYNGSTVKNTSDVNIKKFNIPIPKNKEKMQEWVDKISKPYNEKNEKQNKINELELFVHTKIKEINEKIDCDEFKLIDILIRGKNGKTNTNNISKSGEYPFYSATAENPIYTHNMYDFDDDNEYLLFAKSGGNAKTIYGDNLGIGKFWNVKGKIAANVAMIKFNVKQEFNIKYISNYLKYLLYDIQKFALYSTGNGNINVDDMLIKFKIKIPKNQQFIKDLEPIFQEIETLQNEVKVAEDLYKQYIQELNKEAVSIELVNTVINQIDDAVSVSGSTTSSKSSKSVSNASLIEQCKSLGRKNYSGKTKEQLLQIIESDEPIKFEKTVKEGTVDFYRQLCKSNNLSGHSKLTKDGLIKLLKEKNIL